MKIRTSLLCLLAPLALVVAACGGAASAPTPGDSVVAPTEMIATTQPGPTDMPAVDEPQPTAPPALPTDSVPDTEEPALPAPAPAVEEPTPTAVPVEEPEPAADLPAWFTAELTDVNSGETLTVAGLQGQVVLVETMAIWCSNCLRQQNEVKALHESLGEEEGLITLVLDIDPNEDAANLSDYAAKHGFDWAYAVAPKEVAREIGQLYGAQFLNPPSTPMLIVDRTGQVHLLPFGRKTAEDLLLALEPFLNEGA